MTQFKNFKNYKSYTVDTESTAQDIKNLKLEGYHFVYLLKDKNYIDADLQQALAGLSEEVKQQLAMQNRGLSGSDNPQILYNDLTACKRFYRSKFKFWDFVDYQVFVWHMGTAKFNEIGTNGKRLSARKLLNSVLGNGKYHVETADGDCHSSFDVYPIGHTSIRKFMLKRYQAVTEASDFDLAL